MDAVGLLEGCRDGREGVAGQCFHGEYLYLDLLVETEGGDKV